jgi:hypothetical protein
LEIPVERRASHKEKLGKVMKDLGWKRVKAIRLVAKVDSAAVQDGFDLYLHGFIATTMANGLLCCRA